VESHAAGGTQGGQDGREDADEGLQDELPEVFLGVIAGDHNGVHIGVGHCVVNRLVDGLFYELGQKLLKELFHVRKNLKLLIRMWINPRRRHHRCCRHRLC